MFEERPKLTDGMVLQRFVESMGDRPEKVRVIYHNPLYFGSECQRDIDFAFTVVKNKSQGGAKKPDAEFKACCGHLEGTTIYTVLGLPLRPYKTMAKALMDFLEEEFETQVEHVILDFVVDRQKLVWMIDAIEFKPRERRTLSPQPAAEDKKVARRHCKCCGELRLERELKSQVAMTLVRRACEHMKSRGIGIFTAIEARFKLLTPVEVPAKPADHGDLQLLLHDSHRGDQTHAVLRTCGPIRWNS